MDRFALLVGAAVVGFAEGRLLWCAGAILAGTALWSLWREVR